MAPHADEGRAPNHDRHEFLVTVLLVAAAVATSWSSYEATRWHGEQALATSHTNALRIEAASASDLAQSQTQIDVATFIAWTDADRNGEDGLADFYVSRFRPEFEPAFDAWIETRPFADKHAPPTPFAMPEYRLAAQAEADRLGTAVEASMADVDSDIQRASNYVLSVVLYAVVLFFAGISTKFASGRLRTVMVVSGYVLLVASIAWIVSLPVSFTV